MKISVCRDLNIIDELIKVYCKRKDMNDICDELKLLKKDLEVMCSEAS